MTQPTINFRPAKVASFGRGWYTMEAVRMQRAWVHTIPRATEFKATRRQKAKDNVREINTKPGKRSTKAANVPAFCPIWRKEEKESANTDDPQARS